MRCTAQERVSGRSFLHYAIACGNQAALAAYMDALLTADKSGVIIAQLNQRDKVRLLQAGPQGAVMTNC